jgi:type I restriction enzyme R subunit
MDESQTRQELIDQRLRLAGWDVTDPSQVIQELDIDLRDAEERAAGSESMYAGHQFADYGLLLDSKPIAVVEAKKTSRNAALGREQALQYAANLEKDRGSEVPFLLYTNGHDLHFWEHAFYPPAKIYGFPTRDDFEWMLERRRSRKPLSVELIDSEIAGRDYQIAAIRSVLEGIEAKKRRFLLVMATGTGKTRTATALIDVLRRARWIKRALFLVDRIALRDQALEAFEELIPAEPRWPNRGEAAFSRNRRLYVATYPTMLNLIQNGTTPETYLSPFFFDLIIADESHRSIYAVYKQVLDYFDAIKLGLTATPTDRVDHNTFPLFDCAINDPTFAYSFEEAIAHVPPYLCNFEVLKVRSKFQIEGIQGGTLPAAIQRRLFAEGIDPEEIDFEGTDLERKVTNAGTNALIVREFMEESIKDPTGTLPGKSIIFAISIAHARRLEELFDRLYPEHAGKLARVIVSEDPRAYGKGGLFDQFKTQSMPRVAISVDMLDTGVDILEVVNLVFAKPVYSYTKFWQMIGRGTRVLRADITKRRAWCVEKDRFLIIDCWGNFEFFQMNPRGKEPTPQVPLPVRLFRARLDALEAAIAAADTPIVALIKTDLRNDLSELPSNNVVVLEAAAILADVAKPAFWDALAAREIGFLRSAVAPILRARSAADSKGMRFEAETVEASAALLRQEDEKLEALRESLVAQVAELPLTLNVVAREQAFIEEVLGSRWWSDLSEAKLRDLAARLAPLMRYRQARVDAMVRLDIADLTVIKETIEFGPSHERLTTRAYRERVEEAVRNLLAVNPVLQKLYAGEDVAEAEIEELAALLQSRDPFMTEERLRKVYDHRSARFVQFLKHILGLERLESWSETVTRSFDELIARHNTYSAMQVRFLQTLRTFILQNRRIEKRDLVEAPFTRIHPDGIRGVFPPAEIEEILRLSRSLVA